MNAMVAGTTKRAELLPELGEVRGVVQLLVDGMGGALVHASPLGCSDTGCLLEGGGPRHA